MRKTMTMRDWEDRLDVFLTFNERELLTHAGQVGEAVAEELAAQRYAEFDAGRRQQEREAADEEDQRAIEELRRQVPHGAVGESTTLRFDAAKQSAGQLPTGHIQTASCTM